MNDFRPFCAHCAHCACSSVAELLWVPLHFLSCEYKKSPGAWSSAREGKTRRRRNKRKHLISCLVESRLLGEESLSTQKRLWVKHESVSALLHQREERHLSFFFFHQVFSSSLSMYNSRYIRDIVSICAPLLMRSMSSETAVFFPPITCPGRWKVDGYHLLSWISSDKMKQIFSPSQRTKEGWFLYFFLFFFTHPERLISANTWSKVRRV